MGIAVHPEFARNHFVYIAYTRHAANDEVCVSRFVERNDRLTTPTAVLSGIPAARVHDGCSLGFGPDGLLYISTGDATRGELAADPASPAGKILRVDADGRIPAGNPFQGSPAWSIGHRESQGFAWLPGSGRMYAAEHGPSTFDGPPGGDEINRIVRGGDYGWPRVSHEQRLAGTIAPLRTFTPAVAPSGLTIARGGRYPALRDRLFVACLKGRRLIAARLDRRRPDALPELKEYFVGRFGRLRAVAQGPDGALYVTTSNRDGRGEPRPDDDRLIRLVPSAR
jgi:glucose/arabinose dehydrogenase